MTQTQQAAEIEPTAEEQAIYSEAFEFAVKAATVLVQSLVADLAPVGKPGNEIRCQAIGDAMAFSAAAVYCALHHKDPDKGRAMRAATAMIAAAEQAMKAEAEADLS